MEVAIAPVISSSTSREEQFGLLYERVFPQTASFVSRLGGSFQDAKDVFQDALVIYWEKHQQAGFELQAGPEAYLMGIAKHLWNRRVKRHQQLVPLSSYEAALSLPQEQQPDVNSLKLLAVLERSGKKCLNLLRAFYYDKLPMKQIAGTFGFGTDRSATVQKYKCLEKVRDTLKENSIGYEDFLN